MTASDPQPLATRRALRVLLNFAGDAGGLRRLPWRGSSFSDSVLPTRPRTPNASPHASVSLRRVGDGGLFPVAHRAAVFLFAASRLAVLVLVSQVNSAVIVGRLFGGL